ATIIQNPEEAEFPDMPLAVQDSITVDHSSNLAGMGKIIDRIMKKDKRKSKTIPRQILIEAEVAEKVLTGIDKVSQLGEQSTFSCPDCGGMLFRIKEGNTDKYRCFTGHVYSQETLNIAQAENLDAALWVAIRIMEERYRLLKKMYNEENRKGMRITANLHQQRMEDLEKHIVTLKS